MAPAQVTSMRSQFGLGFSFFSVKRPGFLADGRVFQCCIDATKSGVFPLDIHIVVEIGAGELAY
jgi:hypothetical protein